MAEQVKLDPHWAFSGGKRIFLLHLEEMGITYEQVCTFCKKNKRPPPERMPKAQRERLITFLSDVEQRQKLFEELHE